MRIRILDKHGNPIQDTTAEELWLITKYGGNPHTWNVYDRDFQPVMTFQSIIE